MSRRSNLNNKCSTELPRSYLVVYRIRMIQHRCTVFSRPEPQERDDEDQALVRYRAISLSSFLIDLRKSTIFKFITTLARDRADE
ncbi:hypothetical protein NX059_012216 [Plenodomus lindquistii]|nr:hypothetical protein NX059_012216 [Plenodomus lindquistii]